MGGPPIWACRRVFTSFKEALDALLSDRRESLAQWGVLPNAVAVLMYKLASMLPPVNIAQVACIYSPPKLL